MTMATTTTSLPSLRAASRSSACLLHYYRNLSSIPIIDFPDSVSDDNNKSTVTTSSSSRRDTRFLGRKQTDEGTRSPSSPSSSSSTSRSTSSGSGGKVDYAPIYVSATRQHVGKTTTSLALLSGLQKRCDRMGFMKPVGQKTLTVQSEDGTPMQVDKDAVLVKEHFGLHHLRYEDISPYVIPRGYTRDYLDGKIHRDDQAESRIRQAYENVSSSSDFVLCEGTGHCAVGSIVHASNAQVCSMLNAKMVLVANGGLGNTFDELELNKVLCDREDVEICGVIINKVQQDKLEQTREYISKALRVHWGDVPLLGCIPDRPFLGCPALSDHERLFETELVTGKQHRLRHYTVKNLNLVATSLQVFLQDLRTNDPRTLYVCHSSRDDIILGFLMEYPLMSSSRQANDESALIVTGMAEHPLSEQVMDIIYGMRDSETAPPILMVPHPTNVALEKITHHTPKLNFEDSHRASVAVNHYEPHIDFDLLLERSGFLGASAAASRPSSVSTA
jgi:dethiobiotin synthetase